MDNATAAPDINRRTGQGAVAPPSIMTPLSVAAVCLQTVAMSGSLAILSLAVRVRLAAKSNPDAPAWDALVNGLVRSYYDLAVILVFAAVFVAIRCITRHRPRLDAFARSSFAAVCVVFAILAVINLKATPLLGGPVTYPWLYHSDFLRTPTAWTGISYSVRPRFLVAVAAAPLAILLGGFVATRALLSLFPTPVRMVPVAVLLAVGCTSYAVAARHHLMRSDIPHGEVANALLEFSRSLLPYRSEAILPLPRSADTSDFVTPEGGGSATAFRNLKNVLLVVLESGAATQIFAERPGPSPTPALDARRSSTARFNWIYAHTPASSKSLFSLLTSVYPLVSYEDETKKYPRLPVRSIDVELKARGFRTAFFMSGDLRFGSVADFLQGRGFDLLRDFRSIPCRQAPAAMSTAEWPFMDNIDDRCTAEEIVRWVDAEPDRPFFATFWTDMMHYPYQQGTEPLDFAPDADLNRYLNALHIVDTAIDRIITHLEQRGLLDSTLIAVVGDHGEAFKEHGQIVHGRTVFEEELRVPLLLINREVFKGELHDNIGGLVDVAPTILGLLGVPPPREWQGRSLLGDSATGRAYFFTAYWDVLVGLREGNLKYVFNLTRDQTQVFDLATDPSEATNVAAAHEPETNRARERVSTWMHHQHQLFVNWTGTLPEDHLLRERYNARCLSFQTRRQGTVDQARASDECRCLTATVGPHFKNESRSAILRQAATLPDRPYLDETSLKADVARWCPGAMSYIDAMRSPLF